MKIAHAVLAAALFAPALPSEAEVVPAASWFVPTRILVHVSTTELAITSILVEGTANSDASEMPESSLSMSARGPQPDPVNPQLDSVDLVLPPISTSGAVRTYGGGTLPPGWSQEATVKAAPAGSSRRSVSFRFSGVAALPQFFGLPQRVVDRTFHIEFGGSLVCACLVQFEFVDVTGGLDAVYDASAGRGALLDPAWFMTKGAGVAAGEGKDSFSVAFAVPDLGVVPDTAPDVVVGMLGASTTMPGSAAVRRGDRWDWKSSEGGRFSFVADYARGTVMVKGKKVTLGPVLDGPVAAPFSVDIGGILRSGEVRFGHKGHRLVW